MLTEVASSSNGSILAGEPQQKQLVDTLCAACRQAKAVADSAQSAVLVFDARGNLALSNATADALFGIDLVAYWARPCSRLLINLRRRGVLKQNRALYAEIRAALHALKEDPSQIIQRRVELEIDGEPHCLEASSLPLPTGRLLALHDISAEVKRERQRAEVIDMIVHDLRGPLSSILGSLHLSHVMLNEDGDLQQLKGILQDAAGSAETLLRLVESLLDISKLENGYGALSLAPASLCDIADKAFEMMEVLACEGSLSLKMSIASDTPLVLVDASALLRVMVNLLDNAIRYTPDGGEVRVEAQPRGSMVEVRVVDTGPGIPSKMRSHVFDKYFQAGQPVQRGHTGAGLGLTFCRMIVEAHGGDIWATEGPEGGAAVVFTLPADSDISTPGDESRR